MTDCNGKDMQLTKYCQKSASHITMMGFLRWKICGSFYKHKHYALVSTMPFDENGE